jgi:hypothetical protein
MTATCPTSLAFTLTWCAIKRPWGLLHKREREREREMGRRPCCSKEGLNRGAWTALEDKILAAYIKAHGEGKWRNLPKRAGTYIYTSIFKQNFAAAFFLFQIFSFS